MKGIITAASRVGRVSRSSNLLKGPMALGGSRLLNVHEYVRRLLSSFIGVVLPFDMRPVLYVTFVYD
jgi:hypothetical protein